jgi:tetratricopeptide (TPR) repeat protein
MRNRPKKRSSPWRMFVLIVLIGVALYFNQVVVPAMPPLLIPTPTATRNPESFVNEAEKLYGEGKLTQAIQAYKDAISVDPNNPSNYVMLSRLQVYTGQFDDALVSAQNALLKNPNNPVAHSVYGWALNSTGDYLAAEAAIKRALELDPNNALAHAYLAEILVDQGSYDDLERAIEASRTAKQLDPSLLEAHRARGLVLLATGTENLDEAIAELKAAIAINDKISDLHLSLGYAYKLKGENDLAVE